MNDLLKNNRFYILLSTVGIALFVYVYWTAMIPVGSLKTIRMVQTYALLSTVYLFVTLLIGAFYSDFKITFARAFLFKARRALGVSAFFFGILHAVFSFYDLLGGWAGLAFLNTNYIFSISLGFVALNILTLLAVTSFDMAVEKFGKKWKIIHRLVYFSGFLIVIHALLLGSHFSELSRVIPTIFFISLFILLMLESMRVDTYISSKLTFLPKYLVGVILCVLLLVGYWYLLLSTERQPVSIHKPHSNVEVGQ